VDQPARTAVPYRKQPAELVDHVVGIEADRSSVVAHERARKDSRRPPREIVALEAFPEIAIDLGDRREGIKGDAAPFAFAAQPWTESIPIGHDDFVSQGARIKPVAYVRICAVG